MIKCLVAESNTRFFNYIVPGTRHGLAGSPGRGLLWLPSRCRRGLQTAKDLCWNIAIPCDYNTEGDSLWPALDGRPPSASGGDLQLLDVLGFWG